MDTTVSVTKIRTKETDIKDRKLVRDTANHICKYLNCLGFHVLRYDSPHSTYIKVDGGLCHSIRVSNHKSPKEHLSYRYYVMVDGLDNDYVSKDERGYQKYYVRSEYVSKILSLICSTRKDTIAKYGQKNYYSFVLKHLKENKDNQKGFWSKARTVKCANKTKIEYINGICDKNIAKKVRKLNRR